MVIELVKIEVVALVIVVEDTGRVAVLDMRVTSVVVLEVEEVPLLPTEILTVPVT
jgi:hypothetical protein